MTPNRPNPPITWSSEVWKSIDGAVSMEADAIRVLKKHFMAQNIPTNGDVPVEEIDSDSLEITDVGTRQYVRLSAEFSLEENQLPQESTRWFCREKATEVATRIASLEDALFFQGRDALANSRVTITPKDTEQLRPGLLESAAKAKKTVDVEPLPGGKTYGENTFFAVAKAISLLDNAKPEQLMLFLDPVSYADTFALFSSTTSQLVSLADKIKGLVAGGFERAEGLPPRTGLLARMIGEPACGYYPDADLKVSFCRQDGPKYMFQLAERIQYNVRKPKAFARLNFRPLNGQLDGQ
jgi:hypothetical protein